MTAAAIAAVAVEEETNKRERMNATLIITCQKLCRRCSFLSLHLVAGRK
jgi:hypothetical protein